LHVADQRSVVFSDEDRVCLQASDEVFLRTRVREEQSRVITTDGASEGV
jgi:hypothetical protein